MGISPAINMTLNVCITSLLLIRTNSSAESPYWLVLKGRMRQAYQSLCALRKTEIQAARDLYRIYVQTVPEQQHHRYTSLTTTFCQLFTIPKIKRALLSSIIVSISKVLLVKIQFTFISLDDIYSTLLSVPLQDGHDNSVFVRYEFVIYILSTLSWLAIDRYGCRGALMRTMPHMLWAGPLLAILGRNVYTWSKIALQGIFLVLQLVGGFIPLLYSAEALPLGHSGGF